MAKKRLLIVTHTFLPHVGGIERVSYEQGKRLMRLGYDVTVLTSRMNTPASYVVEGIKVHCYDSMNQAFGLGIPYPIPQLNSFKPFTKNVNQADLIHVHGHPYLSSLFASKTAKLYSKPVVLTQHNTFIEYNSIMDTVEKVNDIVVGRLNLRWADKLITVSNATRRYVLSLGADSKRLTVLHNGVDINRFQPQPAVRKRKRRELGIADDNIAALTVRRLVFKNGIDTLIEAAASALKQNPQLVFLAVGTGPDRDAVQTRIRELGISERFRLMGFVSDADLPTFYNAADLFVLPSQSGEGLPLVSLEAMSCGVPVIATDVGGIREIVPEAYGKFVPPSQPNAMAEAILEFSRHDLQPLRKKLRTMVEQKFSWDKNVEKLAEIYEQLI
jgi:glycosyltransferase involved in cell wall biosynthesis